MIRKAEERDIPRIAEILVFAKRTAYRSIFHDDTASFNELQVGKVMERYIRNPMLLDSIVVYDDGIVKGLLRQEKEQDTAQLCELYVEPFFQKMGIGTKLMQYFLDQARGQHNQKAELWVIAENKAAREFYKWFGFKPSEEKRLVEGTKVIEVKYVKELGKTICNGE